MFLIRNHNQQIIVKRVCMRKWFWRRHRVSEEADASSLVKLFTCQQCCVHVTDLQGELRLISVWSEDRDQTCHWYSEARLQPDDAAGLNVTVNWRRVFKWRLWRIDVACLLLTLLFSSLFLTSSIYFTLQEGIKHKEMKTTVYELRNEKQWGRISAHVDGWRWQRAMESISKTKYFNEVTTRKKHFFI